MGDIVTIAFQVAAAIAIAALALGAALKSRALLGLGASLAASVALTWVLGLLGLPIGIFFGFLGTGLFFRPRAKKPDSTPTEFSEQ
jgi:hypothetical protein